MKRKSKARASARTRKWYPLGTLFWSLLIMVFILGALYGVFFFVDEHFYNQNDSTDFDLRVTTETIYRNCMWYGVEENVADDQNYLIWKCTTSGGDSWAIRSLVKEYEPWEGSSIASIFMKGVSE